MLGQASSSPRVLIVEDNALIAFDLEWLLQDEGFEVAAVCSDVGGALRAIANEAIDVAVVDHLLVGETSDEVIEELSSRRIPTAICSGEMHSDLARAFPGRPILTKPFDPHELCGVVKRLAHVMRQQADHGRQAG